MADNEPMIKLEPGGTAPILSYNVPEPTSYPGRNFIHLQIPDGHFKSVVTLNPSESVTAIVEAESLSPTAILTSTAPYAEAAAATQAYSSSMYDVVTSRARWCPCCSGTIRRSRRRSTASTTRLPPGKAS
jgi:hypothetical protein